MPDPDKLLSEAIVDGVRVRVFPGRTERQVVSLADAEREDERVKLREALASLEAADAAWDTLTAAQRATATRLALRTIARTVRAGLRGDL